MSHRIELHQTLVDILGTRNVYFQPPDSIKMDYPCIVYSRDRYNTEYANNNPYVSKTRYKITVMDKNPDSLIPGKIADLRLCSFATHYTSNNLNHDVYSLYY